MIIFYYKKTGKIKGVIEGRIHGEQDLKMWIGDKKETDRLIIPWKPIGKKKKIIKKRVIDKQVVGDDGFNYLTFKTVKKKVEITEFAPDLKSQKQKEIFKKLDKDPMNIYDFKVDIKSKKLVKKK